MPSPIVPRRSIGAELRLLVAATLFPLLLVGALLTWQLTSAHRDEARESLAATAKALSIAIDRHLAGDVQMLRTLAQSDSFRRGDMDAFHRFASRVAEVNGALFVSVFDHEGRQLLNTALPRGAPLPQPFLPLSRDPSPAPEAAALSPDFDSIREPLATGKAAVSRLFRSISTGRILFTVNIAVERDGRRFVINAGFPGDAMARVLREHEQFSATAVAIVDGAGMTVAHTGEPFAPFATQVAGLPAAKDMPERGMTQLRNGRDREMDVAYERSALSNWAALVASDRATAARGVRNALFTGIALLIAGTLFALVIAGFIAGRLRRSIANLVPVAAGGQKRGSHIRELENVEEALGELASARMSEANEREQRLVADLKHQQAEAENRSKDLFLSVLAHELRNPLATLRACVGLLRHPGMDAEQRGQVIDRMDRQASFMAELVSDLQDASRIGQGQMALQLAEVRLADALRDAVDMSSPSIQAAGHQLELDLAAGDTTVVGDRVRLTQIFTNLLVNAAKYTNRGGRIRVSLESDGGDALVRVRDNGLGITAAELEHIFEPFSQVVQSVGRSQGGLGLGLSVVKGLVSLHGGTIEARSDGLGMGTEFIVRLPARSPDVDAQPASGSAAFPSAASRADAHR